MLLTVSKRLEFSASRRLFDPKLSASENLARFGQESEARYGTGRNYVVYFVFSVNVAPSTGMLMNISEIKSRVGKVLHDGFDHKFLNEDNPAFAGTIPTPENVARELFRDAQPLFCDAEAQLVACHLSETEERSATAYAGGACDSNHWFEFSAARQTMSPHLTPAENEQLFGIAASPFGHGHNYRCRVTLRCPDASSTAAHTVAAALASLRTELDHKHLNHEVPALEKRPITTESLASYIHERLAPDLPVERVRLHERDDFFAEYWRGGRHLLGMRGAFDAAHRLNTTELSSDENVALYGKCNNDRGHGHRYFAEATIDGEYDERSGTLYDFVALQNTIAGAVRPWQDKHLDFETEEFRETPSTGENIVQALWAKLDAPLHGRLTRLRLAETANNRFTLRRGTTLNEGRFA